VRHRFSFGQRQADASLNWSAGLCAMDHVPTVLSAIFRAVVDFITHGLAHDPEERR
jgi:hypothetical protein